MIQVSKNDTGQHWDQLICFKEMDLKGERTHSMSNTM